jgi:GDPmannose 4,6-dehydratase
MNDRKPWTNNMRIATITGITGQDGAYLSKQLVDKGYKVVGILNKDRHSSTKNLDYLGITQQITFIECDLLAKDQVKDLLIQLKPDEIYNLAAQSSVGNSFAHPRETIYYNSISVLNLLDSIKEIGEPIKFFQASSSEMFGRVSHMPITETTPMRPMSPYGVSKASSHWMAINYRENYGIFACCGIMFNHESYLRSPNFFIKKLVRESLKVSRSGTGVIKLGNLDIRRDFGYAPRYVEPMWKMMQLEEPDDFVICSGKSIALSDIVSHVLDRAGLDWGSVAIDKGLKRPSELDDIFGDSTKARNILGWDYNLDFFDVLDTLIEEERSSS